MSGVAQPPGWYPAQGDPPGTVRWWDGEKWVGGPQAQGAQQQAGYVAPGAGLLANGREVADPWLRIAAGVIDGVLITLISIPFGGIQTFRASFEAGSNDSFSFTPDISLGLALIGALIVTLYHTLMNTFLSGGVGKQLLGLRIVTKDGTEPLGVPVGLVRSGNHILDLTKVIPVLGTFIALVVQGILNVISLIFLFSDPEHRTVMDRVADTYVVKKQN